MTRPAQPARPAQPHLPAAPAARPVTRAGAAGAARPGHAPAITPPATDPTGLVDAATRVAAHRSDRHQHLWSMTREQRTAAFFRGELTLGDCQAWSRRYPDEPPTGPCGEYLYILAGDPDWLGEP